MDMGRGVLADCGHRRAGGLEAEARAGSARDAHGDRAGSGRTTREPEWHRDRDLAGWLQRRLCRQPRRRSRAALPASFRRAEGRAGGRDGRRGFALLFARRPVDRFLRRRQAGKGGALAAARPSHSATSAAAAVRLFPAQPGVHTTRSCFRVPVHSARFPPAEALRTGGGNWKSPVLALAGVHARMARRWSSPAGQTPSPLRTNRR